jgi:hypothetical protein
MSAIQLPAPQAPQAADFTHGQVVAMSYSWTTNLLTHTYESGSNLLTHTYESGFMKSVQRSSPRG